MAKQKLLNRLLELDKHETYFGPQGFVVAAGQNEFDQVQLGFGVDHDGADLSGLNEGDWQASWVVFAKDTELGDPYFVDLNHEESEVYTAIDDHGSWKVFKVAKSLTQFLACLDILAKASQQTCSQFVPDENTITQLTLLTALEQQLIALSGCETFWTDLFECYFDWLEDEDTDE
jgi:hypothetical protein